MNQTTRSTLRLAACYALAVGICCAQASSFGQAAQGVATEMIFIARWIGIIVCIVCGFGLAFGENYASGKIGGLFIGLIFALFAQPIVTWIQTL